jgi:hypothetical protein
MKRSSWFVWLAVLLLAVAPAAADGPETGTVTGRVSDATGDSLPGVQVNIEGERGTQVVVTDENGEFRFALLPPGQYRVLAALEGFNSVEQIANVTAGSRSNFEMTLAMATTESITVTSEAPMVDKFNVTAGSSMEGETAGEISATVRSFYGALQVLPGVTNDAESMDLSASRPTVNGSLWQESNVYVDGVDATYSMRGGGTRVFLPSSALTEVNMEAGGGGAEYGRNAGSHTNLIVKSGTNTFHGDFNGVLSQNSWNSNYDPQPTLADDQRFVNTFIDKGFSEAEARDQAINWIVYKPGERDGSEVNLEASLGGPIKRDKAWFFLSRGEVTTSQIDKTLDGQLFNNSSELFATIAKLNFQPGAKHSIAYTYIDAPVDRLFLLPPMGDRYSATFFDLSGDVNSLSWNYSVSSNVFLEAKIATQVSDEDRVYPFPPSVKDQDPLYAPIPSLGEFAPNNNSNSFVQNFDNTWHNGWIFERGQGRNEFPRDQFNLAVTQFAGSNHEFKYGLDVQQVAWDQDVQRPNIQTAFDFELGTAFGAVNNCDGLQVDPREEGRDTRCFLVDYNNHGLTKGSGSSDGQNFGAYVRDRFTVGDHWTVNAGLRFEGLELDNDRGRRVIDNDTFSPRLGVVYDMKGDGRQLVTFNTGRFFVQTPQDLVNSFLHEDWNGASNAYDLRLHVGGVIPSVALPNDISCGFLSTLGLPIAFDQGSYCFRLGEVRPGAMWELVDQGLFQSDIENYHRDEIVLGYEWQYSENWAFDAKGIWWEVDNLIGATLQRDPNNNLFMMVANYEDYGSILRDMGWIDTYVANAPSAVVAEGFATAEHANRILDSFSDDHRRYRALQLQLNRRFSRGWAIYNNLTISNVEGKTYGGGSGNNDLGAFSNLNDDYGRNLEGILTDAALDQREAIPDFCSDLGLSSSCVDDLRPFVGQPLSTINRQGDMPIDRPIIAKSYGYKQWQMGKQTFNLGGVFTWQNGSPWQVTRAISSAALRGEAEALLDNARNSDVGVFFTPRGTNDNDDFWWLNLSGAWNFPIKGDWTGGLRLEISNVFDEQTQVATSDQTGAPLRSRRSFQQPRKFRLVGTVRF